MKKEEKEKLHNRAARLKEYLSAIEQGNFEFSVDLENKTMEELEELAKILATWYGVDGYDSPTEKLLDFVLQIRVKKKDAQFVFNQENIDKINRLDKQLQYIFAKSKQEADSEIYRLKEKMQKDTNIDSVSTEFELINIVFSQQNKSIFFGKDFGFDLFSSNPFFTGELNTPLWQTIYYLNF